MTTTGGVADVRFSDVFLFFPTFSGSGLTTTNPSACSSGCSSSVQGFFAGAGAVRAGLGYRIDDGAEQVVGAAAFSQSGFTAAPAGALVGADIALSHTGAHDLGTFGASDAFKTLNTTGSIDSSGKLVSILESSGLTTIGSATTVAGESGNDGIIGWSRWANGTLGGFSSHAGGTIAGTQSFHNVFGIPTSAADMTALAAGAVTATYTLLGATKPTTDAVGATPGTLTQRIAHGEFRRRHRGVQCRAQRQRAQRQHQCSRPADIELGLRRCRADDRDGLWIGMYGSVHGFFAGAMAARAGVAYNIQNGAGNFVNGAAAMKR